MVEKRVPEEKVDKVDIANMSLKQRFGHFDSEVPNFLKRIRSDAASKIGSSGTEDGSTPPKKKRGVYGIDYDPADEADQRIRESIESRSGPEDE